MSNQIVSPRFQLLTVCTANQCRSPMAEVLSKSHLAERGIDAEVGSCGLIEGGVPASSGAVRAVAKHGLDLRSHRSRTMDLDTVVGSDLIITMERRHLAAVAEICLDAVNRTFTLLELADLAVTIGQRDRDRSVAAWIADAAAMRTPTAVLSQNTDDDLADPMGGPRSAYRRTAEHINERLGVIFEALFPH